MNLNGLSIGQVSPVAYMSGLMPWSSASSHCTSSEHQVPIDFFYGYLTSKISCSELTRMSEVTLKGIGNYPTLAREFQGFRVWEKFVFRTLELTDTPTNLANEVKVGHAFDQSCSVQSRGPERVHQNNEPSWRSSRTDRRLSRQFWDD